MNIDPITTGSPTVGSSTLAFVQDLTIDGITTGSPELGTPNYAIAYVTYDTSIDDGRPFYLYLITKGSTTYRYTSREVAITYQGQTWQPTTIAHDDVVQTRTLERLTLPLTFPRTHPLVTEANNLNNPYPMNLTIYRNHVGTDSTIDTAVSFKGRFISSNVSGQEATLNFENLASTMKRAGLRARFQKLCRHALYSTGCGVNINDFYQTVTVVSISGRVVTVSAHGQENGYFTGGLINVSGSFGYIEKHSGNNLTLKIVPQNLTVSSSIQIAPGCALNVQVCANKFNNVLNFGGYPYSPDENVFKGFAGQPAM